MRSSHTEIEKVQDRIFGYHLCKHIPHWNLATNFVFQPMTWIVIMKPEEHYQL
jgi:hypothetical protein